MTEKLLNIDEACQKLGISEEQLRKLVDKGEIPAYRLGGTILRFKHSQIEQIQAQGVPKTSLPEEDTVSADSESRWQKFQDFLYFNDFYIVSAILVIILSIAIFFY